MGPLSCSVTNVVAVLTGCFAPPRRRSLLGIVRAVGAENAVAVARRQLLDGVDTEQFDDETRELLGIDDIEELAAGNGDGVLGADGTNDTEE